MDDSSQRGKAKQSNDQGRSAAEIVTFGIALAIVASIAGLVIFDWLSRPQTPPVLSLVQPSEVRSVNEQFYVPFEVVNTGGATAESVQVVAEISVDGEVVEEGEQQIEFLSSGETEEGEFVFTHDPEQGELTMRIGSYRMP
jgi:uncharacterized protein (TIGR02588 family)